MSAVINEPQSSREGSNVHWVTFSARENRIIKLDIENNKAASETSFVVTVFPDGRRLAIGLGDGTIRFLDLKKENWIHTLRGHHDKVSSLVLSPDGRLVSGSVDGTIRFWDLNTGSCVVLDTGTPVVNIAMCPDGQLLSISKEGVLKFWPFPTSLAVEGTATPWATETLISVKPKEPTISEASREHSLNTNATQPPPLIFSEASLEKKLSMEKSAANKKEWLKKR
jgi:WD40 repeat protein